MNITYKKIFFISLFIITSSPILVWGQDSNTTALDQIASYNLVEISINPLTPKAGDLVSAELSATGLDINQSKITWYINGERLASDNGLRRVSFNLGKNNALIEVAVSGVNGKNGNGRLEIKPNEVVVIWEATTYSPPFYRGKALAPQEAVFKMIAIPNIKNANGVKIAADKLVYQWTKNNSVSQDYSGFAKNTFFTLDNTYVRDGNNIDARVYTTDNSANYQTNVFVPHQKTNLLLYRVDPLLGRLYNNAIGSSLNYTDSYIKVIAEPYFFSNVTGNNEIKYEWVGRGEKIAIYTPSIEFKSADGNNIALSLTVTHISKILQSANFKTVLIPQQITSSSANTF